MIKYFFTMLFKPKLAARRILADEPSFKRIALFLFWIGLARGILEIIWLHLSIGQGEVLLKGLRSPSWYLIDAIPFLSASIITPYFRWVFFAFIIFVIAKFFGQKTIGYRQILRVFGVIMGMYIISVIPNFLYLSFKLPFITFKVTNSFYPVIGIGQIINSIWITFVLYNVTRYLSSLNKIEAFFASSLIPVLDRMLYIVSCIVYFKLPKPNMLSNRGALLVATLGFIALLGVLIPAVLWVGSSLDKRARVKRIEEREL